MQAKEGIAQRRELLFRLQEKQKTKVTPQSDIGLVS